MNDSIKQDALNRIYGMYMCDNLLLYPNQIGVVKLTTPRCFVRFEDNEQSYFTDFENWKNTIVIVEWLDPNHLGTPKTEQEKESILIDIWNFICLQEEEEERLEYLREQEEE